MKDREDSIEVQPKQYEIDESEKQPRQFKALLLKNLRLQSKQIGTNLCQILTPIICIIFTYLMKTITEDKLKGSNYEPLDYPFYFGNYSNFDLRNPKLRNPLQWIAYDCIDKCDPQFLGSNNGSARFGLLGQVTPTVNYPVQYFPDPLNNRTYSVNNHVPFYLNSDKQNISYFLYDRILTLTKTDFDLIQQYHGVHLIPDGAFTFTKANTSALEFNMRINDARDLDIHTTNGLTKILYLHKKIVEGEDDQIEKLSDFNIQGGALNIFEFVSSAYIKILANKIMASGYYYMPADENGVNFADTVISFVAVLVFPIALSLLFPVFLYTIVLEKEQKLIQMMKMNGMKISNYWLVFFVFNLLLSLITNFIFVFLGYFLTQMRFFIETDPLLLIFTLLGWSLAQIGLSVFFQTFLNKSQSANIIGYLISIWLSMISSALCLAAYQFPKQSPTWMRMFAPSAFVRMMYMMLSSCSGGECYGNINNIPEQMKQQLIFLYINFVFFFILGAYLFEIIPQQFGVTRSPIFPFKSLINCFRKIFGSVDDKDLYNNIEQDPELREYINKDEEDEFSKKQRSDILSEEQITRNYPLIINNIRKLYHKEGRDTPYPALRSFNLKVKHKETFGLLGPNGAGKSTLISILTGMFEPSYGNAWIGGYSVKQQVQKAQLQMGVCPQFDLLWPQLTVEQHLYFYARLKGIPSSKIKNKIESAIKEVKLTKFTNFPSSALSGGMKRRLSVAISLVGNPQIVFLDQPSTGLDPENRRQLWDVLSRCQKKRSILITTHMMEEADTLCNRIGIITTGVLRTVGPQTTLKKTYGGGYRVSISTIREQRKLLDRNSIHMLQPEHKIQDYDENYDSMNDKNLRKSIDSFVELQEKQQKAKTDENIAALNGFMGQKFIGSVLTKEFNGYLIYKVPLTYKVSQIFQVMEQIEKELNVMDVAVTNSSLEDVFMNVIDKFQIKNKGQNNYVDDEIRQSQEIFHSFPATEQENKKVKVNHSQEQSIISKNRVSVMSSEEVKAPKNDPQDKYQ